MERRIGDLYNTSFPVLSIMHLTLEALDKKSPLLIIYALLKASALSWSRRRGGDATFRRLIVTGNASQFAIHVQYALGVEPIKTRVIARVV
jgi:hypothetical protein